MSLAFEKDCFVTKGILSDTKVTVSVSCIEFN